MAKRSTVGHGRLVGENRLVWIKGLVSERPRGLMVSKWSRGLMISKRPRRGSHSHIVVHLLSGAEVDSLSHLGEKLGVLLSEELVDLVDLQLFLELGLDCHFQSFGLSHLDIFETGLPVIFICDHHFVSI
eukprot:TRINITY_DN65887_c0_g1_i1.p1 TRINITY_DN65887_c0_g1~~TRINITY_DN65887_c0_g1_i1.p1  ORF type:complete len:130 (-),score=5.80 TRINITY_DN65887_c0_g1_i1:25-414(-)